MIRTLLLTALLVLPCSAEAFFVDVTYASGEVPVAPSPGGGRKPPPPASSSVPPALLRSEPSSGEVPVQPPKPTTPTITSTSSSSSESTVSSVAPVVPVVVPSSSSSSSSVSSTSVRSDSEILEEIQEFLATKKTEEEQQQELAAGFSITGTSTLGSPLPTSQREAILRAEIQTIDQLKLFTRALVESDENLRKFAVSDQSVSMTYRQTAKLIGFIPVTYLVTVEVFFDGTIETDGPWWLLFASDGLSELEERLQALVPTATAITEAEAATLYSAISALLLELQSTVQAAS